MIFQEDRDAADLVSKLPDFICKFTEVERIFFESKRPTMMASSTQGFEKALIAVYTSILKCSVGLVHRFEKNTICKSSALPVIVTVPPSVCHRSSTRGCRPDYYPPKSFLLYRRWIVEPKLVRS